MTKFNWDADLTFNGVVINGPDLPYSEFFAGNAKKDPHADNAIHDIVTKFSMDEFLANADDTGRHYSIFLGKTFAMTSYLTYFAGKKLERGEKIGKGHYEAVVLAWRVLYEGIGLSGYSKRGKYLAMRIGSIGTSNRIFVEDQVEELLKAGFHPEVKTEDGESKTYLYGVEAMDYAWSAATSTILDPVVVRYLYNAVLTTAAYGVIEREADTEFKSPLEALQEAGAHLIPFLEPAILYGTLRRGSKGLAIAGTMGEETGNGLFRHLTDKIIKDAGGGIVTDMLESIRLVQRRAAIVREADNAGHY